MAIEANVHFEGGEEDDDDRDEDQNEQPPKPRKKPPKRTRPVSRMKKRNRDKPASKPKTPVEEQAAIPQLDLSGDNTTAERVPINPPNVTSMEIETDIKEPLPPPKDLPTEEEFEKSVDKAVKQLTKEAKQQLAADIKAEKKAARRELQDSKREQRIANREAITEAGMRRTQIRSNAVTGRVQSYSLASALGLPGYITASVVDAFFTRPHEERQMAKERQYINEYADYERQLEDLRIQKQREREDDLDSRSPTPVNRDEVRESLKNTGVPGTSTNPPAPPAPPSSGPSSPSSPSSPPPSVPPGSGSSAPPGNGPLPTPPNSGWPKGWNQWGTMGPPGGGSGPPPIPPLPKPPIKPPIPIPLPPVFEGIAAVVEAIQRIQQGGATAVNNIGNTIRGGLNDSPITGLKAINKGIHETADPLGLFTPIAVAGFDQLLSLTEEIRNYAMKDIQFAPETLQASVEGDISKLLQSIDLSMKNDPLKAAFVRVNTTLEMAWADLQAKVFEVLQPIIIPLMQTMVTHLRAAVRFLDLLQAGMYAIAGNIPVFGIAIRALLQQIQTNTAPPVNNLATSGILKQIEDFMNPSNLQDINRRNIPNPVF
jgi:hypothetical protein